MRVYSCPHCGDEFIPPPRKPGLIDECPACIAAGLCAEDVPLVRAVLVDTGEPLGGESVDAWGTGR
jgi:hypothetical protein